MTGTCAPPAPGHRDAAAAKVRRLRPAANRSAAGFTLVEAIVTVALVALVTIPLGRIFLTTSSAANDNSARQQALGLDAAVLSKIGATSYASVGLNQPDLDTAGTADPGYAAAAPGTGTLVNLGASAGIPDLDGAFKIGEQGLQFNVVMPSITWGDRSFKVVTWVTTASSYVAACPSETSPGQPATTQVQGAVKRVTVTASWFSQLSGWISATETTVVYPGGLAPYQGTETPPAAPGSPTAGQVVSINGVPYGPNTQRMYVSWTAGAGACYAISWVTPDQAVHSTGLLANNDSGYVQPPPNVGTGTAWYAVDGLPENEKLTFFVTAYSLDGTVSSPSVDTGSALVPSGPLVQQVTAVTSTGSSACPTGVSRCAYGPPGSYVSVTIGGDGVGTGATMTLVQSNQPTQSIGTCNASPCRLGPIGSNLTGTWSVVATTTTTVNGQPQTVSSPPLLSSDFAFNPTITGLNPSTGHVATSVTVSGTNFISGTTFTYNYGSGSYTFVDGISASCTGQTPTTGVNSCTLVMPPLPTGTTGNITATSPGGTSPSTSADVFGYTS